jgi:hypothetical protein
MDAIHLKNVFDELGDDADDGGAAPKEALDDAVPNGFGAVLAAGPNTGGTAIELIDELFPNGSEEDGGVVCTGVANGFDWLVAFGGVVKPAVSCVLLVAVDE